MADNGDKQTPAEQIAQLYEQAESAAAQASERLVGSGGFASLLGQVAENAAALTKLSADALDLTIRNLRLAGRRDVIRLARQLARTEDKLERVLQEIESINDRLEHGSGGNGRAKSPPAPAAVRNDPVEPAPVKAATRNAPAKAAGRDAPAKAAARETDSTQR